MNKIYKKVIGNSRDLCLSVSLLTATPVFADETGGTGGIGEPVAELVKACGYDALAGSTSAIAAAGVCRKRINR